MANMLVLYQRERPHMQHFLTFLTKKNPFVPMQASQELRSPL